MRQGMRQVIHRVLLASLVLVLAQCTTTGPTTGSSTNFAGTSDLEQTWAQAWVVVPTAAGSKRYDMSDAALAVWGDAQAVPLPTVLYLHGCTGLGRADSRFLQKFADAGFVVIAPDSMARDFRPMQCDPKTQTGGHNLFVYDFRQAEINFALQMLDTVSWVDRSRLFLFGASEGGVAAALYRGAAFKGRVITHWTCQGGWLVRGLEAPLDEPVLTIVQSDDPWYDGVRTRGQSGDCGAFMQDYIDAQSVLLHDDDEHNVFLDPETGSMVVNFFTKIVHQ